MIGSHKWPYASVECLSDRSALRAGKRSRRRITATNKRTRRRRRRSSNKTTWERRGQQRGSREEGETGTAATVLVAAAGRASGDVGLSSRPRLNLTTAPPGAAGARTGHGCGSLHSAAGVEAVQMVSSVTCATIPSNLSTSSSVLHPTRRHTDVIAPKCHCLLCFTLCCSAFIVFSKDDDTARQTSLARNTRIPRKAIYCCWLYWQRPTHQTTAAHSPSNHPLKTHNH